MRRCSAYLRVAAGLPKDACKSLQAGRGRHGRHAQPLQPAPTKLRLLCVSSVPIPGACVCVHFVRMTVEVCIVSILSLDCSYTCRMPHLAKVFLSAAAMPVAQAPHMIEVAAAPEARALSAQAPTAAFAAA